MPTLRSKYLEKGEDIVCAPRNRGSIRDQEIGRMNVTRGPE